MDSMSQAVLGASVAGIVAPAGHKRKALLMGAALGTLPDLDVLIHYGDAVKNFTFHRGFSHSLLVLPLAAIVIWLALLQLWPGSREYRYRWLAAIALALITHPLLDAHTAYGTQLFWPMDVPPTMWATLFIIDPLYTLPLFFGVAAMTIWPSKRKARLMLRGGLALSSTYVLWSWVAQSMVENEVRTALTANGIEYSSIFLTPTPFNTVLWRAVVRSDNGYLEAFDSLVVDETEMTFNRLESDFDALEDASSIWSVSRLRWFASDFVSAEIVDDALVITDLRMGQHPDFVFRHVAAVRQNGQWLETPTELLTFSFENRMLAQVWQRVWSSPQPAEQTRLPSAAE